MSARFRVVAVALALSGASACVDHTAPALPAPSVTSFAPLIVPPGLSVSALVLERHTRASSEMLAGRLREASVDFADALKRAPAFYPAEAGLGDVALASEQYAAAAAHFDAALAKNGRYMPALLGRVDASLALKDETAAVAALEKIVAIEPTREDAARRLDVLRVRAVEHELATAADARKAGHLDLARAAYARALTLSSSSAVILRGLADVDAAAGDPAAALQHARAAVALDTSDAESYATLAGILESQKQFDEAADAWTRATALEPKPEWRARLNALRGSEAASALPAEYRAIPGAAAVTRGQVAAYLETRLSRVIDAAPQRPAVVITDIRAHWAATWIHAVVRAGVMEPLPNHTFQPGAVMPRVDLARAVAQVLAMIAASHQKEAAQWRAAKPAFVDLPVTHLAYPSVALATAAGVMQADNGRFAPTRPASGAELTAAVARLEQLAGK